MGVDGFIKNLKTSRPKRSKEIGRPSRLVILPFESIEQAKIRLHSTEYNAAGGLRHETAISSMVVIEGV